MSNITVLIILSLLILINSACRNLYEGNCYICENKNDCSICLPFYVLNSEKQCIPCEEGCKFCKYNKQFNNTTCVACKSGLQLVDNKCLKNIEKCTYQIINESSPYKNESLCLECSNDYILISQNYCAQCSELTETGQKCNQCSYNNDTERYECQSCSSNYAFIANTSQCITNIYYGYNALDYIYLQGCEQAYYDTVLSRYVCTKCDSYTVFIQNDKICRYASDAGLTKNCLEYENLGTFNDYIYSCKSCKDNDYAFVTKNSTNQKDCLERKNNLVLCSEGKIDENGVNICTKCVENGNLNASNLCQCDINFFSKDNILCYHCNDEVNGNPGCLSEKGCYYNTTSKLINCNECKEGFFKNTSNYCISCKDEIPNCQKCHYDETESKVKCDECDGRFNLNDTADECQIKDCQEYPEISPGCLICKDKLNEYLSKNKCQSCKFGYFKTKEETCVYCRSEKIGGPGCYECGYEKDENFQDTNNIICKNCFTMANKDYYFKDHYLSSTHHMYLYEYQFRYYDFYDTVFINGKCYIAGLDLSKLSFNYSITEDENGIQKLVNKACPKWYYFNSDGNCISFKDRIKIIPNCIHQYFYINNYKYNFYRLEGEDDSNNRLHYGSTINYYKYFKNINDYIQSNNNPIESICGSCETGYYLNDEGKCEILDVEKCTGSFIIQKPERRLDSCKKLCKQKNYLFKYIKYINSDFYSSIDYDIEHYSYKSSDVTYEYIRTLDTILGDTFIGLNKVNNNELIEYILNNPICYTYSNEELNPKFDYCTNIIYIPKTKSLECCECRVYYQGYYPEMDYNDYICKIKKDERLYIKNVCYAENLGTESDPIYSCTECKPYDKYYTHLTMVTYENGIKDCIEKYDLSYCNGVNASSYYAKLEYNCTSCKSSSYKLYFSDYYKKMICSSKGYDTERDNSYYLKAINKEPDENKLSATKEGICALNNYFTPDGKNCFKCDNANLGMPGCKGKCNFDINREYRVMCESSCKAGYLEIAKGVCDTCNKIASYCLECHYETNYPENYFGIKKPRYFQCDKCMDGYIVNDKGFCELCKNSFSYCKKCAKDEITGNYKCIECPENYGIDEKGDCTKCMVTNTPINTKCIGCGDTSQGGILNCIFCQSNEEGNSVICKECSEGYILFNNECLNRDDYKDLVDLQQFNYCLELKTENNKLICSKCKQRYSLLKDENNNSKCSYIPSLYDTFLKTYYYYHYYFGKISYDKFQNYYKSDYNFRQVFYFPCQESVNIGTKEIPRYSCTKCYNIFDKEDNDYFYYDCCYNKYDISYSTWKKKEFSGYNNYYYNYISKQPDYYKQYPVKIIDIIERNISYCILMTKSLINCTEATYNVINGSETYNCTRCISDNYLNYNYTTDINYCSYFKPKEPNKEEEKPKCFVKNCKSCIINNTYFCEICNSTNYIVNKITGSCYENTQYLPSILWKDIYYYKSNYSKIINQQVIIGPRFKLSGTTNSQINSEHAFSLNLMYTYTLGFGTVEIKLPAVCQITSSKNRNNHSITLAEYECIGYSTINENYKLTGVEYLNSEEYIKYNNLSIINDIISDSLKSGSDLSKNTDFKLWDYYYSLYVFWMNETENEKKIYGNNGLFNFNLTGKMSSPPTRLQFDIPYEIKLELYNGTDVVKSYFYRDRDSKGKIEIFLELKNDRDKEVLTFVDSEIKLIYDEYNMYIPLLNEIELINTNPINIINNEQISDIIIISDKIDKSDLISEHNDNEEKSNNNGAIIGVCVVVGVIVIGGGVGVFLWKKGKYKKTSLSTNDNASNDINGHSNKDDNYQVGAQVGPISVKRFQNHELDIF